MVRANKNHSLTGSPRIVPRAVQTGKQPVRGGRGAPGVRVALHALRGSQARRSDQQADLLPVPERPGGRRQGNADATALRPAAQPVGDLDRPLVRDARATAAEVAHRHRPGPGRRRTAGAGARSSKCFCAIRRRTGVSATSSPTRSNASRRRCCASSSGWPSCDSATSRSFSSSRSTRNEELVANLMPQYVGGPWARAAHQRLSGFTLDETRAYVRTCLRGAGCDWAEELMPDDVIVDVQAFTQGVVGDINSLCCAALDAVAARSTGGNRQPRVTRALLKEIGIALNLRYDASAWAQPAEEVLSAAAVHLSDPGAVAYRRRATDRVERQSDRRRSGFESAAHGARSRRQLRHQRRQPLREPLPESVHGDDRGLATDRPQQHERLFRQRTPRARAPTARWRLDRRRTPPDAFRGPGRRPAAGCAGGCVGPRGQHAAEHAGDARRPG